MRVCKQTKQREKRKERKQESCVLVVRVNVSGRFDVASGLMGFRSLWLGCSFLSEFFMVFGCCCLAIEACRWVVV